MFIFLGTMFHFINVLSILLLMFSFIFLFYILDLTKRDKNNPIRRRALLFSFIVMLFGLTYSSAFSILFGSEIGTILFDLGIIAQIVLIILLFINYRKELTNIFKVEDKKQS